MSFLGNLLGGGGGGLPGLPSLPMPPLPPGLPSLPGLPGLGGAPQGGTPQMSGPPSGLGGTMQTQSEGEIGPQNLAGLLQMIGGNQPNPANMNLMGGGLI